MLFGLKVHEILEHIDFKNYKPEKDSFIDDKIKQFLSSDIMCNLKDANIYKEYEFIYEVDNIEYHGIIDLMVEYEDYINIIDYKLNDVSNDAYIKQLKGYKKYVSTKINKPINIYLYSIIEGIIKQVD